MVSRPAEVDFSHADVIAGHVHITVALPNSDSLDRAEFHLPPADAIELGQKLIAAGVRAIRLAVTGK